jgi:hypothetical protein
VDTLNPAASTIPPALAGNWANHAGSVDPTRDRMALRLQRLEDRADP